MRVGFVGWRGMVGSVLRQRMAAEGDFTGLHPTYFSTSSPGGAAPEPAADPTLADAIDLDALAAQQVIVTCQGGAYTERVYSPLRRTGWDGIWIDAASPLRQDPDAMLVLDPINGDALRQGLRAGVRTFVGGNCTVSLMLMGLGGLLKAGHVQWVSSMTYQAASGAGAGTLRELAAQMRAVGSATAEVLDAGHSSALAVDAAMAAALADPTFPSEHLGAPLAASALPWIDRDLGTGQSREEWKGAVEANRLLGADVAHIGVDGICVRIGTPRCHAQALTLQLRHDLPLDEIEARIAEAHPWVEVVPNTAEATLARLTPAAAAGSLMVRVGRLRPLALGPRLLGAFTVGDQLLWGAAEPLRRMLVLVREHAP